MLLLLTDTSGRNGFVALVRAGEAANETEVEVIEEVALAGGTFSAQLIPQIAGLLENHKFAKHDVGAFIVVSGPGSFTGLRVGLAAIKALAEILHKPIVPVSLLEVVAIASRAQGKVMAALDAGRGEVYTGEYDVAGESARPVEDRLISNKEFFHLAPETVAVTSDPNVAAAAKAAGAPVLQIDPIRSEMIARVGRRKLRAGEVVSPEQLEANYGRRSDAELFAKPASGS
jgi:tRNA threonylcarbamoyladenosine biosynthesis protein TsaB